MHISNDVHFYFQCVIMFSIPWSIAACVDVDGRHKFDAFYKDLLGGKFDEHPAPKVLGKIDVPMPGEHNVYDVFFEVNILLTIFKYIPF